MNRVITHNYHTHTTRCGHAVGTEREYVEAAIAAGFTTLGFADHVPYPYMKDDYYSNYRMKPEQTDDYVSTISALKEEYKTGADTHTPEEMQKFNFRPSKFFDFSGGIYNKIDFDIADIKQKLAEFKAEQKQRPAKERKNHHPIFALGNTGYNAEYFIDIIEALGTDAVLYQNEKSSGISYFEAESGEALLCPCRL